MEKNRFKYALLLMALLTFGCAQKTEKEINRKVAAENQINSQADLNRETEQTIQQAPGFTAEQKQKLMALRDQTRAQTEAQNKEILRLKAVLGKELLAENYKQREVNILKRKIKKASDKKLDIYMAAIQQTSLIIGRPYPVKNLDEDHFLKNYEF